MLPTTGIGNLLITPLRRLGFNVCYPSSSILELLYYIYILIKKKTCVHKLINNTACFCHLMYQCKNVDISKLADHELVTVLRMQGRELRGQGFEVDRRLKCREIHCF